jgi:HlyD family secretion protein
MKQTENSTPSGSGAVEQLLGADRPSSGWRRPLWWILALVLLALAGGGYWLAGSQADKAQPSYVTEALGRGDITLTVSANGTVQPTRSVNIGSELSGTVRRVLVDVNDRVSQGQVLVELDTAKLADQVARSRAALAAAQAQLALATATLKESQASLARLEEVARLSGGKVPSAAELDAGRAALGRAQASEDSARAAITQARAALSTDETNLAKASIRSPIDGVVLERKVEPGNAVAASLQAVTLMTIAEDLRRMRVEVSVDEADVGAVQVGQKARFSVSAYPARQYPAEVTRVAFGPTKTDNVVTYTTYLEVANDDLSLRPGMTAAANIVATERQGVLLVPNTALRFTPLASNGNGSGGVMSMMFPRPSSSTRKTARADSKAGAKKVWVLRAGQPVPVAVSAGISDGRMTEVVEGELQEGELVITDQRIGGGKP